MASRLDKNGQKAGSEPTRRVLQCRLLQLVWCGAVVVAVAFVVGVSMCVQVSTGAGRHHKWRARWLA